jgi:hypothetical protein
VTDELAHVVSLGAEVANDFSKLPLDELAFAYHYGLRRFSDVLDGRGLKEVLDAYNSIQRWQEPGYRERVRRLYKDPDKASPVDEYQLEKSERVLLAAVALCRFNLDKLPRGFVDAGTVEPPKDLRECGPLLLAHSGDERLRLLAPSSSGQPLGVFAARKLDLHVVAAQVNAEGSLDMVASDFQHLYYWLASGSVPIQQVRCDQWVEAGAFLSDKPGADAVTVASDGSIRVLAPDGLRQLIRPTEASDAAAVWVDPFDTQQWHVLGLSYDGDLFSLHHGVPAARRAADDLWNDTAFAVPDPDLGPLWTGKSSLTLGVLDGLPCAVVVRGSKWGPALCFVDPSTLQVLRRPMRLPYHPTFPVAFTLAGGRWLLASCRNYYSEPSPMLLVWDLTDEGPDGARLAGACFDALGYMDDPVILAATDVEFRAALAWRGPDRPNSLCVFDWPAATTSTVAEYPDYLSIWPVGQTRAA